jgi:hypothetical protein
LELRRSTSDINDPSVNDGTVVFHGQNDLNRTQEIECMTFEISWFGLGFPGNFPTIRVKRVSVPCFCEEGMARTSRFPLEF